MILETVAAGIPVVLAGRLPTTPPTPDGYLVASPARVHGGRDPRLHRKARGGAGDAVTRARVGSGRARVDGGGARRDAVTRGRARGARWSRLQRRHPRRGDDRGSVE